MSCMRVELAFSTRSLSSRACVVHNGLKKLGFECLARHVLGNRESLLGNMGRWGVSGLVGKHNLKHHCSKVGDANSLVGFGAGRDLRASLLLSLSFVLLSLLLVSVWTLKAADVLRGPRKG